LKIGCGVDIIEIERIKDSVENIKTGKAFIERVFTKKEIEYCESKKNQRYQHYAVRFAAKEAVFKAISDKLDNNYSIDWKDIEILKENNGKPVIKLNENKVELDIINSMDISISHSKQYAVANVVIIFNQ